MKNPIRIFFAAFAATILTLSLSCSKVEYRDNETIPADRMSISITGAIDDYVPSEASKAAVESVVRVKWEDGDMVYVLDGHKCIGYLTASVGLDSRYATLSGVVDATEEKQLLLLYCPSLTLTPGDSMTSVDFDLSVQNGEDIPFVIYQVIDNDFVAEPVDKLTASDKIVPFKFASSIMKVNLTGLADNNDIQEAIISGVNDGLSISMDSGGVVKITPRDSGNCYIARRGDAGLSRVTTDGRATFVVAMVENDAKEGRKVAVRTSNGDISTSDFTASMIKAGASYNSVYELKTPEYVTIGGKKWAIMNLGATTIASSASTAYGEYYEWGVTRKLYTSVNFTSYNKGSINFEDAFNTNGYSWQTYIGSEKWDATKDFKPYDETSKILNPENDAAHHVLGGDWRIPTADDFTALYNACGGTGNKMSPPSDVAGAKNNDGSLNKGIYWCAYDQKTFDDIKVPGLLFIDGNGTSLFFPAAASVYNKTIMYQGTDGDYWSSTLNSNPDESFYFFFNYENVIPQSRSARFWGLSIRPVSD